MSIECEDGGGNLGAVKRKKLHDSLGSAERVPRASIEEKPLITLVLSLLLC